MTSLSISYFYAESLKSAFARDLSDAALTGRISEKECQWLQALVDPETLVQAMDPQRLDSLIMADGSPAGSEMAAAVLISHSTTDDPCVYLSTLLYGLERFDDRKQLLLTLQTRFGSRANFAPQFDYQLIEGRLFDQRMLTILDQQAQKLDELAEQLRQLPSLHIALSDTLKKKVEASVSDVSTGTSVDPSTQLLHIVHGTVDSANEVSPVNTVRVQTLADAALDAYVGRTPAPGQLQRFLAPDGQVLDQVETQRYQRALSDTAAGLKTPYETMLGDYWQVAITDGRTRREQAADGLAEAFRQELLKRRYDGMLASDEFRYLRAVLRPEGAPLADASPMRAKRLAVTIGDQDPLKLTGMFLIDFHIPELSDLLLYTTETGLRRFSSQEALEVHFATAAGRIELLRHSSLNDHTLIRGAGKLHLSCDDIDRPLFLDSVDSIIGLQKRNLVFVIQQPHRDKDQAAVMIDDALDIRRLIDRRLLLLGGGGRWGDGSAMFDATWPIIQPVPAHSTPGAASSPTWLERINGLNDQVRDLQEAHIGIKSCASDVLNKQLAVFDDVLLNAKAIKIQLIDESQIMAEVQDAIPVELINLLLERATDYRNNDVPGGSRTLVASPVKAKATATVTPLTPLLINHILKKAQARLPAAYLSQVRQFYERPLRQVNNQLHPGSMSRTIRESLLRIELALERRLANLDQKTLDMFEQIVDRPSRGLRITFGDDRVEVHALSLTYDTKKSPVRVNDVFVFCQPMHPKSSLVIWSAVEGLRVFKSLSMLESHLNHKMASQERESWIRLMPELDTAWIRRHLESTGNNLLTVSLEPIDGDFIEDIQRIGLSGQRLRVADAYQFAKRCHLEAGAFSNLVDAVELDDSFNLSLDGLSCAIQSTLFEAMNPDWLITAPLRDLEIYANIVSRYYLSYDPNGDFMFGIPELKTYAREKLLARLGVDFPGQALEPDNIQITAAHYVPSPVGSGQIPSFLAAATLVKTETLTNYALSHFSAFQGSSLTVQAPDGSQAQTLLTPVYLRALVRSLDIGGHYQTLLAQQLDKDDPNYLKRQKRFFKQLPASMLEAAFQQKLEGLISDDSYDFIERVIEMPDGIARQPVHGRDIILRPFQLVAAVDVAPDNVPGLYLISPRDMAQGPVILHALYHKDFSFKEYANEASLLEDLRTSPALQTLVLDRVASHARTRYDHGGFIEPHLSWSTESFLGLPLTTPGPVTLTVEPVMGNALIYLFTNTLALLKDMARKQSVTTAQADWQSFTYLMMLGAEQVTSFLPGKLGALVAVWQSQSLFQASAGAASNRRWGKALSEFSAALAMLISSRQMVQEEQRESAEEAVAEHFFERPPLPDFSWGNVEFTPELIVRLKAFEISDVALSDLVRDDLLNLYQDPTTHKRYAAVAGKVYQVQQRQKQWHIVGDDKQGPKLRADENQQWKLDLDWGLRGGGGIITRHQEAVVGTEIDAIFNIEASGMPEIRQLFIDKARRIGQAHQQAKRYLETSLDNLNVHDPDALLMPQVSQIVGEFFGVQSPGEQLVRQIKHVVTSLFNAVMDASLAPYSSTRFVVGTNRREHANVIAFTIKADSLKRIFLTERFFSTPAFRLKPIKPGYGIFDVGAHYRAATLIHELSHVVKDTDDITYLESSVPFLDLLADNAAHRVRFNADLQHLQKHALSHFTPPDQLFKRWEDGQWRDLKTRDGESKESILRITGQSNLEDARVTFFSDAEKRSEVILHNADSVTLLILLLGRERYTVSP